MKKILLLVNILLFVFYSFLVGTKVAFIYPEKCYNLFISKVDKQHQCAPITMDEFKE